MARLESDPVDFLLDDSHDLTIVNGDIVFSTGLAAVQQEIKITLKTVLGEVFTDLDKGIDYFGSVFGKASNAKVQTIFTEALTAIPSVTGIKRVNVSLDSVTRIRSVEYEVTTLFGTVSDSIGDA